MNQAKNPECQAGRVDMAVEQYEHTITPVGPNKSTNTNTNTNINTNENTDGNNNKITNENTNKDTNKNTNTAPALFGTSQQMRPSLLVALKGTNCGVKTLNLPKT